MKSTLLAVISVFLTVNLFAQTRINGVPDTEMARWESILTAKQIEDITDFILNANKITGKTICIRQLWWNAGCCCRSELRKEWLGIHCIQS